MSLKQSLTLLYRRTSFKDNLYLNNLNFSHSSQIVDGKESFHVSHKISEIFLTKAFCKFCKRGVHLFTRL